MKKLILLLCCSAFFCALDGGCFILQVGAWAKMAYAFTHQENLKTAIVKTFDGEHPCEICKHVARRGGDSQQVKALTLKGKIKYVPFSIPLPSRILAMPGLPRIPRDLVYKPFVYLSPRVPPPRV